MKREIERLSLLCCSVSGVMVSGQLAAQPKLEQQPNILLISVDDLNDWIEPLMGHPNSYTPNLNRLAQRSVVFTNAYCPVPLSGPSRTSFLSGMYPSTTGVYYQIRDTALRRVPALEHADFLPEYFARHGYQTMAAGKIFHNGGGPSAFQQYGGTFGLYGPSPAKRFKYDPTWFGKPKGTQTDWGAFPERDEEMPDFKTVEWVMARLKEHHDRPFLLAAGLVRPHVPWYVPESWYEKVPMDAATLPPYNPSDYDDIPEIARRVTELPMMPDFKWVEEQGYWKEIVHAYLVCVTFMDYQVGKLLDALDRSPYKDNTIIVFYGDNGYELGEKERFSKHALWRTSIHVPLMISAPGMAQGAVSSANVGLINLYPTLTELCGLPANTQNEGVSMAPLLKDPDTEWTKPVHTFYGPNNQSLIWKNFHYIRYSDGSEELYDLSKDRAEWTNLAGDVSYESMLSELRSLLIPHPVKNVPESVNGTNDYFNRHEDEHDDA